jgi:hypothetical protein
MIYDATCRLAMCLCEEMSSLTRQLLNSLRHFPHDHAKRKEVEDLANTSRQNVNTCLPMKPGAKSQRREVLVGRGE